jgi:hypothetical protein
MPTLNWIGRDKVICHHQDVPFRLLELRYAYGAVGGGNMIIHGDNLDALKALMPQYEGRVKCVYIDPPYNTGNEGWVYNDSVNDPRMRKRLGEVVGREGEDLTRHVKWLCMMYPRLVLLQKLLANDGVIFISIDDDENASLKFICNEIFGASNFVDTIIWQKIYTIKNSAQYFSGMHDYIVVYAKNGDSVPRIKKFLSEAKQGVVPTTLWLHSEVGQNADAKLEVRTLLEDTSGTFDTPKPTRLNENVGADRIREYVWHAETRQPALGMASAGHPYLLGTMGGIAYYFHYEKGAGPPHSTRPSLRR